MAAVVVAFAYVLTIPHVWQCEGVDEIEYLGLAHSIERGHGFTLYGDPYPIYPPLYPALVSLVMRFDVTAWRAMYALNALMGLAGILYLASWLRKKEGRAGWWAAWFSLTSYFAWSFSTRYLMAEPLFVLVSSVALVEASRCMAAERGGRRSVAAPLAVLLGAMTKVVNIALTAALCAAAGSRWWATRRRRVLALGAAIACAGFGFAAAWEWHGRQVAPHAAESYFRWALKFTGLSGERAGIVARDAGEGLGSDATFPVRVGALGFKLGQYVASFARMPANAGPFAMFLWLVFLTGLAARARRDPSSPFAWYVALSLIMFSLTRWASSYHRYLYPLTPLLYLFLFEGAACWKRALLDRQQKLAWLAVAAFGAAGILWTVSHGLAGEGHVGAERMYVLAVGLACAVSYAAMAVGGLCACSGLGPLRSALPFERILAVALAVSVAHTSAIAVTRFKHTLANETLHARNLAGAVACGQWVKENTSRDTVIAVSLPRLMSFLADRTAVGPGSHSAGYAILTGTLRNVPAFREDAEARLKSEVEASRARLVFSSGDAMVYKLRDMP
ncbi:MAG: hypothetical protein V1929_05375 [bacterium]